MSCKRNVCFGTVRTKKGRFQENKWMPEIFAQNRAKTGRLESLSMVLKDIAQHSKSYTLLEVQYFEALVT